MKIKVTVTLKNGVLDPQGKAIQQTLNGMGFSNVEEVRQGKYFEVEVNEKDDRIKSKITSIIRDRVPPLTSQEAVTTSDYSDEKVQTKSFSNLRSPSDRQEPPVSNYDPIPRPEYQQERFNDESFENQVEFEQEVNPGYSTHE